MVRAGVAMLGAIALAALCLAGSSSVLASEQVSVVRPAAPPPAEGVLRALRTRDATLAQTTDPACGLCTKDDDCGSGHKCCQSSCPSGQKKCLYVTTCP
ncbi:MAG: hypothetical protein IT538_10990 [Variibacter sp.]|nr:hypothetical protein [Variibacter sp.]